jgi:Flp pilus assembly protein TadG
MSMTGARILERFGPFANKSGQLRKEVRDFFARPNLCSILVRPIIRTWEKEESNPLAAVWAAFTSSGTGAQPMILRKKSNARRQTGSATVELVVALPVMVGLMLGIWEVGRLVEVQQIMSNAAREGVRQAATGNYTAAQVTTIVNNYLTNAGINNSGSNVYIYNLTQDPTPTSGQASDDPTAANQLEHLHLILTLPFSNVKWAVVNKKMTSVTTITATADFDCLKDKPLTVDSTLPSG